MCFFLFPYALVSLEDIVDGFIFVLLIGQILEKRIAAAGELPLIQIMINCMNDFHSERIISRGSNRKR